MNHKQYKDWILNESDLDKSETEALQTHFTNCNQCSQLNQSWKSAQADIEKMKCVNPQPGFVTRWNHTLQYKKHLHEICNRRISLLAMMSAATISGGYYLIRSDSITRVFATLFTFFSKFVMGVSKLSTQISGQVNQISPYVSWVLGFFFFGICLAFLFAFSLMFVGLNSRKFLYEKTIR